MQCLGEHIHQGWDPGSCEPGICPLDFSPWLRIHSFSHVFVLVLPFHEAVTGCCQVYKAELGQ